MNLRNSTSVAKRREVVENATSTTLTHIGRGSLDEARASTHNCENMIGVVQIPLGVAGPLKIHWKKNEKEYIVPLATTEGALVASINRGCKAITQSGGANVCVERKGTTRAPVFETQSLSESFRFVEQMKNEFTHLQIIAQQTSSHISLIEIIPTVVGTLVYLRCSFHTQDAMGMNMATIASQHISNYLEEQYGVVCLSVSGNTCVDKKPSWQNVVLGRGYSAWSEVFVSTTIITETLKTTTDKLYRTYESKCLIGGAVSGSIGFNGHAANVIAAIYLATGQDPAHVVEGSQTITTMKREKDGMRVSVYIPSLLLGTVGGGTELETQRESLQVLGIAGGKEGRHAEELAGIVCGTVLAGEISELAALSSGTLTSAHTKLARGKML